MPGQFLFIIDVIGTVAFAISGAYLAIEKRLDPFGVLVLAFVTAIGGGTLRDMMIGNLPVSWLRNETTAILILSSAILTMFFGKHLRHLTRTLFVFDALGLGLFTVVGIQLGQRMDFSPGICIALGTITACFGGVVRDVLLNTIPLLFRKEIYAVACIAGGILYFLLASSTLSKDVVTIISIIVICSLRLLAVRYRISLPRFYER